jgi:signal transduction histidine kinase/DNA-binding response OmpR family regulator
MMKMQSTIEATKAAADLQARDSGPMVALARYLASKRVLPFYYALAAGVLIIVSFALIMMALRNDQEASTVFIDNATFLLNGLVTLSLFYGALLSYFYRKRVYSAWLILAAATFSFTIGDFICAYMEIVLKEDPFLSIANYFFLAYYPLFLLGIFSLPAIKFAYSERFKMMLDTGIVMVSAILVFWSLIIGPAIQEPGNSDLLTLFLSIAFPVADLILLFSVLELLFKRIYQSERTPLLFLAGGIISLIVTDSIYFRLIWEDAYVAGGLLDLGWPFAYLLIGLAGISQANAVSKGSLLPVEDVQPRYGQLTWPLYLPYICAAGAFALLIWSHDHSIGLSFSVLSWAVAIIVGLVVVRQILVLNENVKLYHEAQLDIRERKRAQQEIIRLNEELEERVAQRTEELEIANRDLHCEVQERTLAEAAMKDSEHRLADIINFLPDATFVIDKEGTVIAWNLAIEKMTGFKAVDILGKDRYEYSLPFYGERRPILIDLVLKPCSDFEKAYDSIKKHDSSTIVGESFVPDLNGKAIYLLGSAAVLYDSEGNIYGAIESIRDITERKKAEEDLKNARDRAESATKSKSKFLANMSHEIRTPMNAVIGMTGLLLETKLMPEQRDYLEIIRNSGSALLAVINDILDYSKIDGDKLELEVLPFNLMGCIEISMDLVAAKAAEKGLELTYFQKDGVPTMLKGDEIRLRQILINLLGNAVKFTEKGEVMLSVSSSPADDGKVELHFEVKDTGIGITQENLGKLFQFFTQVDSSTTRHYGGTGLGLAISRRLVEMMGGKIWAESERGVGSTFHFTISCAASDQGSALTSSDPNLAGKRVLIVEGNQSVRNMIAQFVQSWGMEMTALATSEEALENLDRAVYDFVILDAILPDIDGPLLARQIRAKDQSNPFIVMVSQMGSKVVRDDSVSGWLSKPLKPTQFKSLLQNLITPKNDATKDAEGLTFSEPEKGADLTILLAEDNFINQKVALSMLKHLGYRADVAMNGLDVMAALQRKQYDVILMDIQMPDMDGLDATRRIREQKNLEKQPCIIAITAYALEGDREEFLNAGMNDYLSKPIQIEELKLALEKCSAKVLSGK